MKNRNIVTLFVSISLLAVACSSHSQTQIPSQPQLLSREEAISVAQKYIDGTYGIKSEDSPVNATQSLLVDMPVWIVEMPDLPWMPDNGPPDPLGRRFHDIGVANLIINAGNGNIIKADVHGQRVYDTP